MATRPITDPFVLHACELLSCLGPVKAMRMFGGYGLSTDRKFNRMRPSMARVLGLETRSAKEG